ncbi:hypothetical protein MPH_10868 [Macrophomina phaseolina MS6]|uniref:Uncharacterized protein n=1 Tax=Macrophomina phaseolina (strain MS6) TaxID=1126212 RepID=K2RBP4_MACPH|nr:hypothetical protein MPH_10868 [Macrophomina phaseolina MS6]
MGGRNKKGKRNGGYNNYYQQPRGNNKHNHSNNQNKGKIKAGKCSECGSLYHFANQCDATLEDKAWKLRLDGAGWVASCPHCGKQDHHLPVNCFKNPKNMNRQNNQGANGKRQSYCEFCKRETDHTYNSCQESFVWKTKLADSIANAAADLPYCIICGGRHQWESCQSGRRERREREFTDKAARSLTDWLEYPPGTDPVYRALSFCGYCEEFGNHNSRHCHDSAEGYARNRRDFLTERFGTAANDVDYDSDDEQPCRRMCSSTVDGGKKQRVTRPVVERKCRMCRTLLPKLIKPTECQPDLPILVKCVNTRCGNYNELEVENADGTPARAGSSNWGGLTITTREHAARFLSDSERDYHPHYDQYTVTLNSQGQPFYDGPQILTRNAARFTGTDKYNNGGWWDFNEGGNYQLFFPPATIHFTPRDRDVRAEPNCAMNHSRSGLIPFCHNCGEYGVIFDDENDVVMGQTGPDNEGNFAGSGYGCVGFPNPQYNPYHSNDQSLTELQKHPYIDSTCFCTWKFGVGPDIVWMAMRLLLA